jgi:rhodanese-related sulfurtransferase
MILVGRLTVPVAEFEQQQTPEAARFFAGVAGLRWKIWLLNRDKGEAGGVKLFADEAAYDEYVNGPIMAQLLDYPLWTDVRVLTFDYMPAQSAVTRAPVGDRLADWGDAPLTFNRMAAAAFRAVPAYKPAEVYHRIQHEPELLVIDVQDAAAVAQAGTLPGAVNLSYGSLTFLADHELPEAWRDPRLADHARPIVTTCGMGPLGALGGKLLHDMGFSQVGFLEGGVQAWREAGFAVQSSNN